MHLNIWYSYETLISHCCEQFGFECGLTALNAVATKQDVRKSFFLSDAHNFTFVTQFNIVNVTQFLAHKRDWESEQFCFNTFSRKVKSTVMLVVCCYLNQDFVSKIMFWVPWCVFTFFEIPLPLLNLPRKWARSDQKSSLKQNQRHTGLFPSLWTFFWKHYNYVIIWIFGMLLISMSYLRLLFYNLFQKITISGQERQICERNLKFFASEFESFM